MRGPRHGGTPATGFFLLVLALSVPIWVVAGGAEVLPGLPASALMVVCPALAAGILILREDGARAVVRLLRRSFDFARIPRAVWYLPVVLLAPVLHLTGYWVMRIADVPLPDPQLSVAMVAPLAIASFIAALAEELGWSAYAVDRAQDHCSALRTGLQVGMFWALWHLVPMAQVGRSMEWIAAQALFLVAFRVLLVWLYNNAGQSVFAVAVCHATANVSWQLFPNQGSHYDPRVMVAVAVIVAAAVTVVWGPTTLASRTRAVQVFRRRPGAPSP